jgi:hypothetical protein
VLCGKSPRLHEAERERARLTFGVRPDADADESAVQQEVAKAARTLIEVPPMQAAASFNMSAVKEAIEKAIVARAVGK